MDVGEFYTPVKGVPHHITQGKHMPKPADPQGYIRIYL